MEIVVAMEFYSRPPRKGLYEGHGIQLLVCNSTLHYGPSYSALYACRNKESYECFIMELIKATRL